MTPTSTNRVIYKYTLEPQMRGEFMLAEIALPYKAQILHVAAQWSALDRRENICVWASVLKEEGEVQFRIAGFAIVPTGGTIPEGSMSPKHLGTVLMEQGSLVFHVFQL